MENLVTFKSGKKKMKKNKVKSMVNKREKIVKGMIEINGNIYLIAINKTTVARLFKAIDHTNFL